MKALILFVLFFLLGCCGMLVYLRYVANVSYPHHITTAFSLEKAPKDSLTASITSLSGDVEWTSRVATQPAKLTNVPSLKQGEEIETGKNGSVSVLFQDKVVLSLSANTHIALIQTLPINIVVSQSAGTVVYTKKDTTPFSVRTGDIVMNISTGTTDVFFDTKNKKVFATVRSGSLTAAYTDVENSSQVLEAKQGQQLVFDDKTLTAVVN